VAIKLLTIKKVKDLVLEILFPIFCIECRKEGEWWCKQCLLDIHFEAVNNCPICGQLSSVGRVCETCETKSCLAGVNAVFKYQPGSAVSKLLKQYKYQGARDIEKIWSTIFTMWKFDLSTVIENDVCTIMPVPLHPRRLRERGFNQAVYMAKSFNQHHPTWGYDDQSLIRVKYTQQQARLSGDKRRNSMQGVFGWKSMCPAPEQVILVDDVFTTGSTMQECAQVLKEAGSAKVWGIVLARD
jgi:ComF family protein